MRTDGVYNFSYDERRNLTKVALVSDANNNDVDWFDALGIRTYSRRYDPAASDPHRLELTSGIRPEVVWEEIYSTPNGGSASTLGKRYYVLGPNPDERLIYIDATQGTVVARYPHANKRGETIAIAKAGTEDSHYVYGAFGESTDAPGGYPWRYTGQRLNEWTGLYHYKARAYSPALGRFLQPDPIGYKDGPNIYAYVGNNPFNLSDPEGAEGWCGGTCIPPPIGQGPKRAPVGSRPTKPDFSKINIIGGKPGDAQKTRDQIESTFSLKSVIDSGAIEALNSATTPINIRLNDDGEFSTDVSSVIEVSYDPNNMPTYFDTNGIEQTATPESVITHELIEHGLNDKPGGSYNEASEDEISKGLESEVLKEQGRPARRGWQ